MSLSTTRCCSLRYVCQRLWDGFWQSAGAMALVERIEQSANLVTRSNVPARKDREHDGPAVNVVGDRRDLHTSGSSFVRDLHRSARFQAAVGQRATCLSRRWIPTKNLNPPAEPGHRPLAKGPFNFSRVGWPLCGKARAPSSAARVKRRAPPTGWKAHAAACPAASTASVERGLRS